jgi:hypothetical protein
MPEENAEAPAPVQPAKKTPWTRYVVRALVAVANTILILASLYLVWGWITLSDIRAYCDQNRLNFDDVMIGLQGDGLGPAVEVGPEGKDGTRPSKITPPPTTNAVLKRLRMNYTQWGVIVEKSGAATVWYSDFSLITPFTKLSENVVNTLFAFGAAYVMSTLVVLAKSLKATARSKKVTAEYVLLRPLCGALAAGCLYVLIMSGGRLIWTNVSNTNSLAIGVIAAIATVYCEKFEAMLKSVIDVKKKVEKKNGKGRPATVE